MNGQKTSTNGNKIEDDELDSGADDDGEEDGDEDGQRSKSSLSLLYDNPATLTKCKRRPDLNRDAYLNKCYSGRAVLSVYAAFVVDWLEHFPGNQVFLGKYEKYLKPLYHFYSIVRTLPVQLFSFLF